MPLDEDSKKLLAINTHKGVDEYNRLTFGIASAPSIYIDLLVTPDSQLP
jgi:hypothetical protein